ncbi:hypothetical protein F5Y09DRAFT_355962 [Xylaria sp. FL1042]|nr:hypothetical protein F5Y09DRAFT_355962 [Xylaria sp. FL1042]
MESSKPALGHSSTYGQACLQCYKAKCRCVPNAHGQTCERCHRLKKRCQPSDSIRSRAARKAEESDSRIAQLESKIETLVSAMQSIVSSSGSSISLDQPLNEENISLLASSLAGIQTNSISTNSSIGDQPTPQSDNLLQDTTPVSASPSIISQIQAEKCLNFFRSRMLPCFPFIDLAPSLTAEQLRQNRPFLFQAILTVTTFSTQKKLALAEDLKRSLFTSTLLNVESSIDLLLGLLTYLAWSTDAFLGRADLISRLMMLATSLVYDLRLFKPCRLDVQLFMTITQGGPYESNQNADQETIEEFMEKQRALLACYVLSSNVSSHLGRQDALRWTPQMEEACYVIEKNEMLPTDRAFAIQVRLHVLKHKAAYIRDQHERDGASTTNSSPTSSIPGLFYLKTMRGQLHELASSIPTGIYQENILNVYVQYIELYINQLAYSISFESPLLDISRSGTSDGLSLGYLRLECLWRSVESIKRWVDKIYEVPPSDLVGFPFHFWAQMIQCITILKYLSTLEDPTWDCQAVRNTVDLISTMDRLVQQLDMASKEPGLQCDDSLFQLLSRLLCRCRAWANAWWNFAPQVQGMDTSSNQNAEFSPTRHRHNIPDLDQMVWMQSIDLDNDQWLENVLGDATAFS